MQSTPSGPPARSINKGETPSSPTESEHLIAFDAMQERLELGFDALERALVRVADTPLHDRFAPLAEALLWTCILNDAFWKGDEEAYRLFRDAHDDGRTIEGLRYARHRLVHDIAVYGMHGAISLDTSQIEWSWRSVEDLQEADDKSGEDIYRKYLQGQKVEPTLHAAQAFLIRYRATRE